MVKSISPRPIRSKRRFLVTLVVDEREGKLNERALRLYLAEAIQQHGHTEVGHMQLGDHNSQVEAWKKVRSIDVVAAQLFLVE